MNFKSIQINRYADTAVVKETSATTLCTKSWWCIGAWRWWYVRRFSNLCRFTVNSITKGTSDGNGSATH